MEQLTQDELRLLIKVLFAVCDSVTRNDKEPIQSKHAYSAKPHPWRLSMNLVEFHRFYDVVKKTQQAVGEFDSEYMLKQDY